MTEFLFFDINFIKIHKWIIVANFLDIPRDAQLTVFSFLDEDVFQTAPYVCSAFDILSRDSALWQFLSRNREEWKKYTLRSVCYANQLAMRFLVPKAEEGDYRSMDRYPFEQRFMFLRLLEKKIDAWRQANGNSDGGVASIPKAKAAEIWRSCLRPDLEEFELDGVRPPAIGSAPLDFQYKYKIMDHEILYATLQAFLCIERLAEQIRQPHQCFKSEFERRQALLQFRQSVNPYCSTLDDHELKAYLLKFRFLFNVIKGLLSNHFGPEVIVKLLPMCPLEITESKKSSVIRPLNGVIHGGKATQLYLENPHKPGEVDALENVIRANLEGRFMLKQLPPILMIRMEPTLDTSSYIRGPSFVHNPICLPEDGIVDLTPYYAPPEDQLQSARYKIRSYVFPKRAEMYGTSFEMEGIYYSDRRQSLQYETITKDEFFAPKTVDFFILERVEGSDVARQEVVTVDEEQPHESQEALDGVIDCEIDSELEESA